MDEMDEQQTKAWDFFLATHLRYEDSPLNWSAIFEFLREHALDFDRDSLHLAYSTLRDTLELIPVVTETVPAEPPPAPAQPQAPVPVPDPRAPQMFRNGRAIPYTPAG